MPADGIVAGRLKSLLALTAAMTILIQILTGCVTPEEVPKPPDEEVVIVTGSTVNVRCGADSSEALLGTTRLGTVYDYIEELTDDSGRVWYRIQYSPEEAGWISGKYSVKAERKSDYTQAVIDRIGESFGAVGIQAAVIEKGMVTGTYSYGWAIENRVKITSDTKIRTASLSKTAVAVNAMKMHEQGIVSLDENIGTYWNCKPYRHITLKSLLSHTSPLDTLTYGKKEDISAQLTDKRSYRSAKSISDDIWQYSNYGIGLAGATLELAAAQTLDSYAADNVFHPLGMDAAFSSGLINDTSLLAELYHSDGNTALTSSKLSSFTGSDIPGENAASFAGGLTCSAKDYAKLIAMLASDGSYCGTQILSPQSVEEMETVILSADDDYSLFGQCLPMRLKEDLYGHKRLYYHTGNAYGVLALAAYDPDTGDGVVVLTTGMSDFQTTPACGRDRQGIYDICSWIGEYILRYHQGVF